MEKFQKKQVPLEEGATSAIQFAYTVGQQSMY